VSNADDGRLAAPSEELLTVQEAHDLIYVRLGLYGPDAAEWLSSWIALGVVEPVYEPPIADSPHAPPSTDGGPGGSAEGEPHPSHWRLCEWQLVQAIRYDPREPQRPWCSRVPEVSGPDWVNEALARAMVVKASGYDRAGAAAWVAERSLPLEPQVRVRFAPRTLAQLEQPATRCSPF
jgi:hypothetical protein